MAKIQGMSQDTYNKVEPWAQRYGVPDAVWMAVAGIESGGDPKAHNPSGAYGLFQLLTPGGQGDSAISAGHSISDLYDPGINAQFAMPAIASAYKKAFGSNPDSSSLGSIDNWVNFAGVSGHPGGNSQNGYTVSVGKQLAEEFILIVIGKLVGGYQSKYVASGGAANNSNNTVDNAATQNTGITDVISGLQKIYDVISLFSVGNIKSALFKTGLFLIAAIFIIIGFLVIAKNPDGGSVGVEHE